MPHQKVQFELDRPDLSWLDDNIIKPYVFIRQDTRIKNPGSLYKLNWFSHQPLYLNPLLMENVSFADQILRLESKAFAKSNMAMPRWVFYDCAIIPGFVAGFAIHRSQASNEIIKLVEPTPESEWLPISLFIIIPTMGKGEWVAHNLSSINSMLPKAQRFYGLGFLTKAFGLWYANIEVCVGMTQWKSPAIRLHSHYGDFEVLTAYTPVHSHAKTLTYRLKADPEEWVRFFTHQASDDFHAKYISAGFSVDPNSEVELKAFQHRIERGEGPFYLSAQEIRSQSLEAKVQIYHSRSQK